MTVTWQWCCEAEPRLLDLERDVLQFSAKRRTTLKAYGAWYGEGGFKSRLCDLVGWGRNPPGYVEPPEPPEPPDDPAGPLRVVTCAELLESGRVRDETIRAILATLTCEERLREVVLMGGRAYDAVYDHLLDLMPRF